MAVSEHAIRVIPKQLNYAGILFTYLSSPIGQNMVRSLMYGSVIDEITPEHIKTLPIPINVFPIQNEISQYIKQAGEKRDHATELILSALELFYEYLKLKPITATNTRIFDLMSDNLTLRLDASHYEPSGRMVANILAQRKDTKKLEQVTEKIYHPFRMNMVFVKEELGVPFLGGGDIIRTRYFGDKYIAPVTDNYDDYILQYGSTLMTIGGTIGRVTYVGDTLNGAAASQHVTRIVPNQEYLLPGYLYIFIESDYAQHQVKNLIYGSVVDTIRESQLANVLIPVPPFEVQKPIHDLVDKAYRNRHEANCLEDKAQTLLSEALGL